MRKIDKLEEMERYWERVGGYLPEIGDIRKVKSRDDLMAWLYTDTFWTNYWLQECDYLADMIMMDCWSKLDVKIFHTIGVNVVVDNISYFDKDEVLKVVGCGDTQWRESVGKLDSSRPKEVMLDNVSNALDDLNMYYDRYLCYDSILSYEIPGVFDETMII